MLVNRTEKVRWEEEALVRSKKRSRRKKRLTQYWITEFRKLKRLMKLKKMLNALKSKKNKTYSSRNRCYKLGLTRQMKIWKK